MTRSLGGTHTQRTPDAQAHTHVQSIQNMSAHSVQHQHKCKMDLLPLAALSYNNKDTCLMELVTHIYTYIFWWHRYSSLKMMHIKLIIIKTPIELAFCCCTCKKRILFVRRWSMSGTGRKSDGIGDVRVCFSISEILYWFVCEEGLLRTDSRNQTLQQT